MYFTIIKVGYDPDLSQETKDWIRENITPSLSSEDSSSQYSLDTISEGLSDEKEEYAMTSRDVEIFQEAYNQNVEYFEF